MKIIFSDGKTATTLPVMPPSFQIPRGVRVETINIHMLGDVAVVGKGTLPPFNIECMFPAQAYPFAVAAANTSDPYYYVRKLSGWCEAGTPLRLIVSGTQVNLPVIVTDIEYGEQDGTGDVYAVISLQEHRALAAVQFEKTGNSARSAETAGKVAVDSYTVKRGDTLSAICRKFYGNASLYPGLAKYNGIKNPNLIYPGNVIKLPDKSLL